MSTKIWSVGRSVLFMGVALVAVALVDQMVGCMSAPAQQRSIATSGVKLPATVDDLIRQMAGSAGVIFVGKVVAVRRPLGFAGSPQAAAEGVVETDFHVEQAVRGPKSGSTYTLREWGGLWAGGIDRYHTGQRLLLLLRSPDSSGLSSPVHGAEGAIPLRGIGAAQGPDDTVAAAAQWAVDISWLQAQTLRTQVHIAASRRGPTPVRGGPRSELGSVLLKAADPQLVHAMDGPWVERTENIVQVESLAHVLGLCSVQVEQ